MDIAIESRLALDMKGHKGMAKTTEVPARQVVVGDKVLTAEGEMVVVKKIGPGVFRGSLMFIFDQSTTGPDWTCCRPDEIITIEVRS